MNNQYNGNNYNPYNQYNNGYNNQMPPQQMPPQQYHQPDDNRGGGFFSFLLAFILLAVAVVFLLQILGIIDVKEIYDKYVVRNDDTKEVDTKDDDKKEEEEQEKDEISSEIKKQLDEMCPLIDENGTYVDENKDDRTCKNKICTIEVKDYLYSKKCDSDEYIKESLEEKTKELERQYILNLLCSMVDEAGNYTPDEADQGKYSCNEFVCKVNLDGKEYTGTCKAE